MKRNIRKRGADMMQTLLYAMFALMVLVGTLYIWSMIDIRRAKAETTTVASQISSEVRAMFTGYSSFERLTTDLMIDVGSVPNSNVRDVGGVKTIMIPHGGNISLTNGTEQHSFIANVSWPENGRAPKSVCLHMSSTGINEVSSGPMGTNYKITDADCDAASPYVTTTYYR